MAKTTPKPIAFGKSGLIAAIAASTMLQPSRLNIEALDGDVFVKRMTLGERDQYFADMKEVTAAKGNGNAEAFIHAIVTEDGQPMFTADDLNEVHALPPALTGAVLTEFNKINHFVSEKPVDKDGEPEDGELKNS